MKFLIPALCLAALVAAAAGFRLHLNLSFSRSVRALLDGASAPRHERVSSAAMEGLPEPVRRYFRFALRDGLPQVKTARLTHGGRFRTSLDGTWAEIRGEEYFTCVKPGFIWRGFLTGASAVDRYVEGKGTLSVYLLSTVKIMEGKGRAYDQGELLRWLGEAVWFPTALVPGENIRWKKAGRNDAILETADGGLTVSYRVEFADSGEIVRLETMRYMNGERMEKWVGVCSDWRETAGMKIPFRIKGGWVIGGEEKMYADFILDRVEYDAEGRF